MLDCIGYNMNFLDNLWILLSIRSVNFNNMTFKGLYAYKSMDMGILLKTKYPQLTEELQFTIYPAYDLACKMKIKKSVNCFQFVQINDWNINRYKIK